MFKATKFWSDLYALKAMDYIHWGDNVEWKTLKFYFHKKIKLHTCNLGFLQQWHKYEECEGQLIDLLSTMNFEQQIHKMGSGRGRSVMIIPSNPSRVRNTHLS